MPVIASTSAQCIICVTKGDRLLTLVSVDSVLGIDVAKAKVDTWFQHVTHSEKPKHQC